MTTQSFKRCRQCGEEYVFQGSGPMPSYEVAFNHDTWCPSCMGVIRTALAAVPRKFESRWRSTTEVPGYETMTLDEVLYWERTPDPFMSPIPPNQITAK